MTDSSEAGSFRAALRPLRAVLLAAPLLLAFAPPGRLPPGLAYAVGGGRWLALLGVGAALVALAGSGRVAGGLSGAAASVESRLGGVSAPTLHAAVGGTALVLMLALIPGYRWSGSGLSGDEPKYLALAESLYRDLDVDVSSTAEGPLTPGAFAGNLGTFARAVGQAIGSVATGVVVPEDHVWNQGNWTLAGRQGGRYLVQSPGLPAVLMPGLLVQRVALPALPGPALPLLTLALLWAFAATQIVGLAVEVSGSRLAGLAAGAATALSAPLFVGGYHFYPETVAAAVTPWFVRHVRSAAAAVSPLRAAALAFVAGALPWLHPKFLLLSLACAALLAVKVGRQRALSIVVPAAALPMAGLLLFDHHVTGLLWPDALYRRYGDQVYAGPSAFLSPDMASGLSTALFGARDGLLIMAPVLVGGLLALPVLWRRDRRAVIELALVFTSLWVAAAVHGGGAGGPPGRLMAPVATLLAVPLAVGLLEVRSRGFRWTVAGLVLVSGVITLTMLGDWRRTVNPYRHMFAAGEEFFRDLPDGPLEQADVPSAARRQRDVLGGMLLGAVLVFWALVVGRPSPAGSDEAWPALRDAHLAWWGSLALLAFGLHALRP